MVLATRSNESGIAPVSTLAMISVALIVAAGAFALSERARQALVCFAGNVVRIGEQPPASCGDGSASREGLPSRQQRISEGAEKRVISADDLPLPSSQMSMFNLPPASYWIQSARDFVKAKLFDLGLLAPASPFERAPTERIRLDGETTGELIDWLGAQWAVDTELRDGEITATGDGIQQALGLQDGDVLKRIGDRDFLDSIDRRFFLNGLGPAREALARGGQFHLDILRDDEPLRITISNDSWIPVDRPILERVHEAFRRERTSSGEGLLVRVPNGYSLRFDERSGFGELRPDFEALGFESGDVIAYLNGRDVHRPVRGFDHIHRHEFERAIQSILDGEPGMVEIKRGGRAGYLPLRWELER